MWSWILKAVLAVSKNPQVQAWAEAAAIEVISKLRHKAEAKAQTIADAAKIELPPHPLAQ